MAWRQPSTIPFTRIAIVSAVPSTPGVFAVADGATWLMVGESWNLKARLLELANVLKSDDELQITWEVCSEEERITRRRDLEEELIQEQAPISEAAFPGICFRPSGVRPA